MKKCNKKILEKFGKLFILFLALFVVFITFYDYVNFHTDLNIDVKGAGFFYPAIFQIPAILKIIIALTILSVKPVLAVVTCLIYLFFYFITYDVFITQYLVFIYFFLVAFAAYYLTKIFAIKNRSLLGDSVSEWGLIVTLAFIWLSFLNPFTLLLIHKLSILNLFLVVIGESILFWLLYKKKQKNEKTIPNCIARESLFEKIITTCHSFEPVTLFVLIFFLFLTIYRVMALCGDENKVYLTLAKHYAAANSIMLSDYLNGIAGEQTLKLAPHFQEMILSSGYVLGGALGIKFAAFLIHLFKIFSIFALARGYFKLSFKFSCLTCISYLLIPYFADISVTVRLENFLTYTIFGALFFLGKAGETTNREEKCLSMLIAFSFLVISISTKYIAFYAIVAILLVFYKEIIFCFANINFFFKKYKWILLFHILVGAFWYARTFYITGDFLLVDPYGKSHLTIKFPPLRSLDDIYFFITRAFIFCKYFYTEFETFGFGLWGFFFIPILTIALAMSKNTRKLAIFFIIYMSLLCSATRQIRYLVPIIPILIIIGMDLIRCGTDFIYRILKLKEKNTEVISFIVIIVPLCLALPVFYLGPVNAFFFHSMSTFGRSNINTFPQHFEDFNAVLKKTDIVMGAGPDIHFSINANYSRRDHAGLQNLCKLHEAKKIDWYIFYLPNLQEQLHDLTYDPDLLKIISTEHKRGGKLVLLKPRIVRIRKLCSELKKNTDLIVMSEVKYNTYYKDSPLKLEKEIVCPRNSGKVVLLSRK